MTIKAAQRDPIKIHHSNPTHSWPSKHIDNMWSNPTHSKYNYIRIFHLFEIFLPKKLNYSGQLFML